MARPKKIQQDTPEVIGGTLAENETITAGRGDIALAVSLPNGIIFNDVPKAGGGFKTIKLPGLNDSLRGQSNGLLVDGGQALCVRLPLADWEALKAIHGKSELFTGVDGYPPVIREFADGNAFESAKRGGEFADVKTGLEGADPEALGVKTGRGSR